jgi:putative membrane protein
LAATSASGEAYVSPNGRPEPFWLDAVAIKGAVTLQITVRVLIFTLIALAVCVVNYLIPPNLGVGVAPYEVAGAALAALLVLRTNAGYERWWEGRKLWGGMVNQSRILATAALTYGPDDPAWRKEIVRWTAAFAHASRLDVRGQRDTSGMVALLGPDSAAEIAAAHHLPTAVSLHIAALLRVAYEQHGMDRLAFAQAEAARCQLIDYLGGCERILKTPLPRAYGINIRRFILLFLATLPFSLLDVVGWLTPLVEFLVAYPILALDEIGVELQNPFSPRNLGHLPLDEICLTIERDVLAIADAFPRTS